MLPYNAHKNSQGFTTIEIIATVIIVGILSAIAAPSFLAFMNRNKVTAAVDDVRGVLQESQRQAIRKSTNCTVTIPAQADPIVQNTCSVTGDRSLKGITIRRGTDLGTIKFNFKGRTITGGSDEQAIVFSFTNDTSAQERCLMISKPLGVIRIGVYNDSQHNRTTVDKNDSSTDPNCKIPQPQESP